MTAAVLRAERDDEERAPLPSHLEQARRKFEVARSAVRVAMTGPDMRLGDVSGDGKKRDYASPLLRLETMCAVYIARTTLSAPVRHLAAATGMYPVDVRRMCEAVERMRGAPVIELTLARVEAAVPVDP